MVQTVFMRILVVWASRHGSTKEIAEVIHEELVAAGIDADIIEAAKAEDISAYDGLVLGSSVYMTQWEESMRRFIRTHKAELFDKETWTFSVGLSTVNTGEVGDSSRVGVSQVGMEQRMNKQFTGCLDPTKLNLRERSIARLGGAVEGDFRDWDAIRDWARKVAADVKSI